VLLIGNKRDKAEERVITTEEATEFAKSHEMQYFETSAKNGMAVEVCVAEMEKNNDQKGYEVDLGKSVTENLRGREIVTGDFKRFSSQMLIGSSKSRVAGLSKFERFSIIEGNCDAEWSRMK
jgi:imidazole glycerol phosphate synthase subunit HisF